MSELHETARIKQLGLCAHLAVAKDFMSYDTPPDLSPFDAFGDSRSQDLLLSRTDTRRHLCCLCLLLWSAHGSDTAKVL